MFSRQNGLGGRSGGDSHLVEFRAGRMNMVGNSVHPDNRKGLVYLTRDEDGLMHFCWKDLTTGKVEDDLIIFPGDCEYKRVDQCKTGRVYVLKFKSSSLRMFFCMQEPNTDGDEECCHRVNALMNHPRRLQSINRGDLERMMSNISQQELLDLICGGGGLSLLGLVNGENSLCMPSTNSTGSTVSTLRESALRALNSGNKSSKPAIDDGSTDALQHSPNVDLPTAIINSDAVNQIVPDTGVTVDTPDEKNEAEEEPSKDEGAEGSSTEKKD